MATPSRLTARHGRLGAYAELTKLTLSALVLFTTSVGYVLGSKATIHWLTLLWTMLGTALAALGTGALNQWMERRRDGLMERTGGRPLPSGRLSSREALVVGVVLLVSGPTVLVLTTNALTALLAVTAVVVYLGLYTPLKTRTPLCTLVGGVCGALPPMLGWTAAAGQLEPGAWVLGAILFAWQIPHFLALGWLYRDDYARAGFRILPVVDRTGDATGFAVILYALAMLPLGLAATLAGLAGWGYAVGAILLGIAALVPGVQFQRCRSRKMARRVFLAGIAYLPLVFCLMMADRGPIAGPVTVAPAPTPWSPWAFGGTEQPPAAGVVEQSEEAVADDHAS